MIKDKKEKQSGGSSGSSAGSSNNTKNNNSNSSSNNASSGGSTSSSSPSSSKSSNANKNNSNLGNSSNSNKSSLGIKEEIIEQGSSEQLIVTSIKHEDGSPPSTIIKKESVTQSSSLSNSGPSTSSNVSNDSNNNNDANDNKNSNSSGNPLLPDDKDSINDNSIPDELLNNDDINASGSGNNSSSKLGAHIKNEEQAIDPLASAENNSFGSSNLATQNRSMIPQNSPDRIQPLPSNVVNKQSNSMDYMQQQSQIFVFSTALANKGADAVRSGQFPTIIAYHCAQPETKKFLQKFPLKVAQFNRSGWFPNMTPNITNNKKSRMMPINQQNYNFMKGNPMNNQQVPNGPINNQMGIQGGFPSSCDMNTPEGNALWNQGNHQQINMDSLGNNGPNMDPLLNDPIDGLDPLGPNSQGNQMNSSHQSPMGGNLCMDPTSPSIPSLQGVKVPDEDLTPQQRSQRAMKLAQLQELKQMFKQEPPLNAGECQMNEQDVGNVPCSKMNQMNANPINPMIQGGMMQGNPLGPMNPMNGPMRPNFPMGPRGNMCRPMGPGTNPNAMNEEMMPGMGSPMGGPINPGNMQMGPGGAMMGNMNMPPHMQGGNIGMNNMGPGNCNMNNMNNMPSGVPNMGMMKGMPPQMMGGPPGQAHMEWNKLQQQYYDENKRKGGQMCGPMDMNSDLTMCSGMGTVGRQMPPGVMRNMPNMRGPGPGPGQGPPPPYHQTPRSASVPIATQSPNPNSPNNPTSNLSLPSPRGSCNSTLNSPAGGDLSRSMNPQHMNMKHMNPRQSPTTSSQDSPAGAIGRQMNHSNPSTPISSHLSPSASLKDLEMSNNPNKEPNLMPVPSPQQISYLNTFESQELTIQKQPNTNIKDSCSNMGQNQGINLDNRMPGQKTPTSSNPHMNNFPIPSSPHTPGGSIQGDKRNIASGPSPQNSLQRSNSMMGNDLSQFASHQHPNNQQQSNESNMQFPSDTPNMPFGPNAQQQQQNKMGNFMDQKPNDMGNNGPPPQFAPCSGRPDLPLNPNSNATVMSNTKPSHFDPISSLAQMSQQLSTAGVPGSLNGQQMMSGFNNNGMMNEMGGQMNIGPEGQMGGQMEFGGMVPNMGQNQYGGPRSMSPKIGGPQMGFPGPGMPNMRMARPMGYNGTNIQVKPNAPNTIQYLPARPQMNNANPPRGPPSLDFLQRFTNPMGMDEMNKGGPVGNQQNMPYFPNQNNSANCGMGPGMDPIDGSINPMGPGNGPPMGMMNQNPMMMRGMRGNGGGNMMRFPGPAGVNNPCMMGNAAFNNSSNNPNMGGDHQMMFGGPGGQQNPQMFVAGPKGSPMNGPPNPEQMQMMSGPPHFKQQPQQQQQQSHFPSTADPNYAQQYHNFQQQLYATNNNPRNQMGMGGNQAFMPK